METAQTRVSTFEQKKILMRIEFSAQNLLFRAVESEYPTYHYDIEQNNKNTELKKRAGNWKLSRKLRREPVFCGLDDNNYDAMDYLMKWDFKTIADG